MLRHIVLLMMVGAAGHGSFAQDQAQVTQASPELDAIRARIQAYVETFNKHDAGGLSAYWTADGESVAANSGERTVGREALQEEFQAFFSEHPESQLSGEISSIRLIRPDVATVDGVTRLIAPGADPVETTFSAVVIKDGDQWLISSSHEHDTPPATSSQDALQALSWLVGTWEDETDEVRVTTTVRWTPNRAFLIRSFAAQYGEGDELHGTQIIGWDPARSQYRTWTFNSDGSFAEGFASRSGNDWLLKSSQVLSDGRLASGTQVLTRIDDDTLTVQTIGQTIDGEPRPASNPVTVVRTAAAEAVSSSASAVEEGATP